VKDISEEKSATKGVGLYRVVGKWHFLAGLLMIHRTLRGDPSRALAGAGLLQPRRNGAMVPGGLALAAVIVTLGFVGLLAMVPISTAYGWGKCGREGETTCTYPNTGPVIMRYGQTSGQGTELKDQWYWSYHDGRVKIRCDNAFGDPHHGVDKVCEVLPIEAKDFAPITGYKRCSNLYGTCNVGGTPDQPRWVRYGNAESGWSYGLAAGSVKCDWDMVGDALWGSGLPGYCEVGPAHNLLNEAKDWQFCASENQACTVKPDGRPVTLRFGDARNAIYRVFDSANAPATLACNNGIIGYDPAPGQAKFCHFSAGKTVVEKMVGRWELVKASASPGDMTYAINIGVTKPQGLVSVGNRRDRALYWHGSVPFEDKHKLCGLRGKPDHACKDLQASLQCRMLRECLLYAVF